MGNENLKYSKAEKSKENQEFIKALDTALSDNFISESEAKDLYKKYKSVKGNYLAISKEKLRKLNAGLMIKEDISLGASIKVLEGLGNLQTIYEGLNSIKETYRSEYPKEQIEENKDKIVPLSSYGIEGKNVYYKYSQTSLPDLIDKSKLKGALILNNSNAEISPEDAEQLKFDNFNGFSEEEKIKIVSQICQNLNIQVTGGITKENVSLIRDNLILSYNNSRLRGLGMKEDIEIREEVAKRLQEVSIIFKAIGYGIEVTNGLRTTEMQRMIKENHAYFKGQKEADTLFASDEDSPHLSGGAVDIILTKDGKPVNLKLKDNSQETKEPGYQIQNPTQGEKEILKLRRKLLTGMVLAGFAPNPREYWHFSYGDKMSSYINRNLKSLNQKK